MTETALKPCPFCGGNPNGISLFQHSAIMCKPCDYIISRDTPKETIEAWNTRENAETRILDHLIKNTDKGMVRVNLREVMTAFDVMISQLKAARGEHHD